MKGILVRAQFFRTALSLVRFLAFNPGGENTLADIPVLITGPNPPSELMFTSEVSGLEVSWTAPTIGTPILDSRIRILFEGEAEAWVTVTGTSHTFADVENNTEYVVQLQARNSTGYSPIVSGTVDLRIGCFPLVLYSGMTSVYKLNAATLALAEGTNIIDLSTVNTGLGV